MKWTAVMPLQENHESFKTKEIINSVKSLV